MGKSKLREGSLAKRLSMAAVPYLLAPILLASLANSTVSTRDEKDHLLLGLRPAMVGNMISANADMFQAKHQQTLIPSRTVPADGLLKYASLSPSDSVSSGLDFETKEPFVTGSINAKPRVIGNDIRIRSRFPEVNRAEKSDRLQLRSRHTGLVRSDEIDENYIHNVLFSETTSGLRGSTAGFVIDPEAAQKSQEELKVASEKHRRELHCLAKAIYFEARSEPSSGRLAVAQVVMNRVEHWFYPNDICGVVFQNQHRRNKCQFSFACDGQPEVARDLASWNSALTMARQVINEGLRSPTIGDRATHYHATYVRPRWIRDMIKIEKIGRHIFYRVRRWS